MKLIFAIVNGDDSHAVSKALTANGFFATKLASTGGFLSAGNTTFLICTDNEKVDLAVETIKDKCHKRKQFVQSAASSGIGSSATFPVEVSVGGATIFITDVERFEKI
ncbi:MAG: cyclic-di-AMP receptor [Oscillospiraceae bacterium]|nr:cyclic-di-AMP receptor [Oscillospiraceae bacterium]